MKKIQIILLIVCMCLCTSGCFISDWFGDDKEEEVIVPIDETVSISGTVNVPTAGVGKVLLGKVQYKAQKGAKVYLLQSGKTYKEMLEFLKYKLQEVTTGENGKFTFSGLEKGVKFVIVIDVDADGKCDDIKDNIEAGKEGQEEISSFVRERNIETAAIFRMSCDKQNYSHGETISVNIAGYSGSAKIVHLEVWNEKSAGKYIWTSEEFILNDVINKTYSIVIPNGWPSTNSSAGANYKVYLAIGSNLLSSDNFNIKGTVEGDVTPPESGEIIINSGDTATNDFKVKLTLESSDAGQMSFSNSDNFTNCTWEAYSTSKYWYLLSNQDGEKTVYVKFADVSGNQTQIYSDTINYDTQAPTDGSVVINSDAVKIKSTVITLTIASTGSSKMMISNFSDFNGAEWQEILTSKPWELSAGTDGERTVYMKFKDNAGNESDVVSDSSTLDTTPPMNGSLLINAGASITNTLAVTLTISVVDATTMIISNQNDFSGAAWEDYAVSKIWNLSAGADVPRTTYIKFKDDIGNETSVYSDSINCDTQAPTNNSITINSGAAKTKSNSATLTIASTGATKMMISNSSEFTDAVWQDYLTSIPWELSSGDDGERIVYIKFKDIAENETISYFDSIILDTTAPSGGSLVINNGGATTAVLEVSLTISAIEANYMMISEQSDFSGADWENYSTTKTINLDAGLNGTRTVYVKFKDDIENISDSANDEITLDMTPPADVNISSVVNSGPGKYTLSWGQSVDPDFSKYEIHVSLSSGFAPDATTLKGSVDSISTLSLSVDGLQQGKTLYFKVVVVTGDGRSSTGDNETSCNDDLIGWWHFDEGSGSEVVDSTGNHTNGTINYATFDTGKINTSIKFSSDANVNYVEIPHNPIIYGTGEVTIAMWVWLDNLSSSYSPFVYYKGTEPQDIGDIVIALNPADNIEFASYNSGFYHVFFNAPQTGRWYHFAGVIDSSSITFYVDGVMTETKSFPGLTENTQPHRFGASIESGYTNPMNGLVDEARLYRRALSADDVLAIYNYEK